MHRVLAWVCLMMVASMAAFGLQLSVAAIVPAAVADQPGATYQAFPATLRKVLIVVIDPVSADHAQVECAAVAGTFATDVMVVEASEFAAVTRACKWSDTP